MSAMELSKLHKCFISLILFMACGILSFFTLLERNKRVYNWKGSEPQRYVSDRHVVPGGVSQKEPHHRKVLVLTYMRSGSTLLGDILQHHPNSFYAFEPLRYINEDVNKGENVSFFDGTTRYLNQSDVTRIHAEMVYRWLTCDFDNINIKDITSRFIGWFSHNLSKYAKCLNTESLGINICVAFLRQQCHNATVRIVKTIRMRMGSAVMLMKWLPELRVIHLLRDPRGKITSELGARMSAVLSFVGFTTRICDSIMADTRVTDYLRTRYPTRIRVLLYETLAMTPIETSRNIYTFLNMEYSNSTIDLVREFTQSGGSEDCRWCTKRTKSRTRAYLWRSTIDLGLMALIDRQCYFLYRKVGYVTLFPPEDIRKITKPIIVQTSFTHGAL